MRSLSIICLLASTVIPGSAADNASLTGQWLVHQSAAGHESEPECTFTQNDSTLTGTCKTDSGAVEINGKLDGKNITWTYKGDSAGGPVTVIYTGTVESTNKITGRVAAVEFSVEGEFTATRSK